MATETTAMSARLLDPIGTEAFEPGLPASSRRRYVVGRQAIEGTAVRAYVATKPRLHVLNELLFQGALLRERRTADRTNQPFGLLLVRCDGQSDTASLTWEAIIDAVACVKRDTDVIGWFDGQTVLGVLLSEIGEPGDAFAEETERRVQGELARRLGPATASRISVSLHLHREAAKGDATRAVEPLIEKMRAPDAESVATRRIKRAVDILGSLALLIILSPVFLVVAVLVKLTSRGPIFFRQKRIGAKAQPFMMLKFRSMSTNVDSTPHQDYVTWFINSSGRTQDAGHTGVFKLVNDSRITPVGHILRRTSVDELPQLWNVVRGDMSLVGPRPPLPYEVEQYKAWHCRRVLEAKPGITGLWQVTGRSRTTFDEMVRLDLRYARTCSLWTDVKILLATPRAVLTGKGAC